MDAKEALKKLQEGNARYVEAVANDGDVSKALREDTCNNGQHPYAVVLPTFSPITPKIPNVSPV